jgi:hypothetical protein
LFAVCGLFIAVKTIIICLLLFGLPQWERDHLVNPQFCLALLPFPAPVAVRKVILALSLNSNSGIHNMSVVVCNLCCDRGNDQQVSSGRNLKGLDKLIIIMIYTKLKFKHRQNTGSDKILAVTKYWGQQNVGIDKIFTLTECSHQQNIGINKIFKSTKCLRWQNIGIDRI